VIRFLHSSDWQLGMTRHYLGDEAQAAFSQARFDAIVEMATLAENEGCEFVVVAGDVFETNQVDRRTLIRACEALEAFRCPVYLLPGNHDCLDPSTVFRREDFRSRCPDLVEVLDDGQARHPCEGVEVVGVPWTSKHPLEDLVARQLADRPPPANLRVVVAHGAVDVLDPDRDNLAAIRLEAAEQALADGQMHYLALGDRHSLTEVGKSGRVWYSGAPEATSYREIEPGCAIVVELSEARISTQSHQIGRWHYHLLEQELLPSQSIDSLRDKLSAIPHKSRAIAKLKLRGSVTLSQLDQIESLLADQRELFAALEQPQRHRDVSVLPDLDELAGLHLHGWAAEGANELQSQANSQGPEAEAARDALGLLMRLQRKAGVQP
jgi:DNA repair exonuclease SbcCD nuclease subunit